MPSSVPAPQPACVARDVRKLVGPRSLVSPAVGHQVSSRSLGATSRTPTPRERIARRTLLIVREIDPTRAGAEPKDGEDSGVGSIEVSNPYSRDEDGPSRASPLDEACARNESDSQHHHLKQHEQPKPLERDDRDERQEHQRGHEPPSASEPPPFQSELDRFLAGDRGLTKVDTAFMTLCDEANTWDRRSTLLRALAATSEVVLASFVAQDGLRLVLEGWLRAALESDETQFVPNMLKTMSLIPATLKALKSPCKLGQLVNSIVKNKEGAHDQGTVAEARMIIARWRKLAPASSAAKTGTSAGAVKAPPAPSRVAPSEGPDPNGRSSAGQEKPAVKSERISAASAAPTAPIARKATVGAEPVEKAQKRLASKIAENPAATKRRAVCADGLEDVDLFAAQKRPLKRQDVPKPARSARPVSTEPASKTTRVRVVASNAAQLQSATRAQRSTQVARVSANPLDMLGINRGTDKPQSKDYVPPKQQRRVVLAPGPSSSLPLSATASERAMAAAANVPDEPPRERRQAPSVRRKVVWADGWSSPNTPPKHPEKLVAERTFLRNDPPIMAREDAVYDEEAALAAQAAQTEMTEYVEFGEKAMGGKKREAQALLDFKAKEDQERREVEERLRALVPTVPWRIAPDIPQSILAGLAFQPGRGEASREVSERRWARGNLPPAPHGLDSPEEPTPGSNRPMRLLHLIPNIPLSVEEANAAPVGATQAAQAASAHPRRMQGLHGDRGVQGVQGGPSGNVPMQMQMQNGVPAQTANGRRQWGPGAGTNVICKFHNTPGGCQYGGKCRFRHVDQVSNPMVRPGQGGGGKGGARPMMRR